MSAGTDYAIAELQHAVRELAARVDSIEHSTCQDQGGLDIKKLTALPVGAVVEDRRGRRWKRADDGKWYRLVLGVVAAEGGAYSHELHTVRGPLTEVDDDEDTDEADYLSVDDLLTARFDVPVRDRHGDRWTRARGSLRLWISEHEHRKYVSALDLIPKYGPIRDADPEHSARRPRARLTPAELDAMPTWARVEDHIGNEWERGDDGKWHRRVTEAAPPITAHMSSSLTMLRGPIFPSEDFIAAPHPAVPPKPCDMAAGSTVTDRYGSQWTKLADPPGMWKGGSNMVTDGILTLVFGPFRKVSEPARRIDTDESLRNLDVGARVRATNGVVWEKQDDGKWTSDVPQPRKASGMLWVGHGPVFTLLPE